LVIEDSADDAMLLEIALQRAGYDPSCHRVETPTAMTAALERQRWDLIIADYRLPDFDGLAALALVKEKGLDLPFIIVSGYITEETAVAAMKAGAHDYVMKDKLARLGSAVERGFMRSWKCACRSAPPSSRPPTPGSRPRLPNGGASNLSCSKLQKRSGGASASIYTTISASNSPGWR
jgi:DNA-binding NtrC family response regulator